MGVGGKGHGVGGGDLLREGVLVGQKGFWGVLVGPRLLPDVTGRVVPIESGGYPGGLLSCWQLLRQGGGGWSRAPGFLFGFLRVGS